jgi:chemotaxis protein MotA
MFIIIGGVIVIGCVLGGYAMAKGHMGILFQPSEFIIIGGAALGSFVIASPLRVLKQVFGSIGMVFKGKVHGKDFYLQLLTLLYDIFAKMRKEGLLSIEKDLENPESSAIFQKYPDIIHNHHLTDFIADNLKIIVSIPVQPHEIDNLMELDIESTHNDEHTAAHSINTVAESFPGLGIVAAVLGVVITMGSINEPPEVLGHHIGAALIGTFVGILVCYGFLGPFATNMGHLIRLEGIAFNSVKAALVAYMQTTSPQMAVEFGRRAIPAYDRPSFSELEKAVKKK